MQSEAQQLNEVRKTTEYIKNSYDLLKKNYTNQYIAIKDGKIIAHDKDIDTVFRQLKSKKINLATVLIEFLHPKDILLVL